LPGELRVINSYIFVNNAKNNQIFISRGTVVLPRYDTGTFVIGSNRVGSYEVQFPFATDSLTLSQLSAFSHFNMPFPDFAMERGRIYSFRVNPNGTVTGPVARNILN
jgi:hypothetical protein